MVTLVPQSARNCVAMAESDDVGCSNFGNPLQSLLASSA